MDLSKVFEILTKPTHSKYPAACLEVIDRTNEFTSPVFIQLPPGWVNAEWMFRVIEDTLSLCDCKRRRLVMPMYETTTITPRPEGDLVLGWGQSATILPKAGDWSSAYMHLSVGAAGLKIITQPFASSRSESSKVHKLGSLVRHLGSYDIMPLVAQIPSRQVPLGKIVEADPEARTVTLVIDHGVDVIEGGSPTRHSC